MITRRAFLGGAAAGAIGAAVARRPAFGGLLPVAGRRVIVLGGGMGGLAVAHELAERGFEVTVFEAKALGGKARSIAVPASGTSGRRDLPGEHGFRFFPGFYHHVPDTMRRIPRPGGGTVRDNLVEATTTSFARAGREDFVLYPSMQVPGEEQTFDQLLRVLEGLALAVGTIPPHESAFWARQVFMYVTSCTERRFGQWEYVGWWDYVRAATKSAEYQKMLATGLTRNLVAAKAELASTRTIGNVIEAFFTNALYRDQNTGEGPPDQVLNGPTNDAWINPWVAELERMGVAFRVGYTVESLDISGGRLVSARVRDAAGTVTTVAGDWFVCALPVEKATPLWSPDVLGADPRLAGTAKLQTSWMNGIQYYLDRRLPVVRGHYSYVDSPWALTSINQQQFWAGHDLATFGDGRVRDILSVDISNWDAPGILYGRPARECTADQIAAEVWAQIKEHLNDTGREVIVDQAWLSWFLDPAIRIAAGQPTTNDEPLLVNTIGSWDHRPEAVTAIPNLFLASDYVRTDMDLATMEAANEAGRRAATGVLTAAGSNAPPVKMYQLFPHPEMAAARAVDAERYRLGLPHTLDTPEDVPTVPWPAGDVIGALGRRP